MTRRAETADNSGGHATAGPHPPTRTERAVVLGGPGAAIVFTAASSVLGMGGDIIAPLWLAAVAWTVLASLACALLRGIRHGDRSAFRRCALPDNGELVDWTTRTGPAPMRTCPSPRSMSA